jgi:hypothetical protein
MARIDVFASHHPHTIPVRSAPLVGLRGKTMQSYKIGGTCPQNANQLAEHAAPGIGVVDGNAGSPHSPNV